MTTTPGSSGTCQRPSISSPPPWPKGVPPCPSTLPLPLSTPVRIGVGVCGQGPFPTQNNGQDTHQCGRGPRCTHSRTSSCPGTEPRTQPGRHLITLGVPHRGTRGIAQGTRGTTQSTRGTTRATRGTTCKGSFTPFLFFCSSVEQSAPRGSRLQRQMAAGAFGVVKTGPKREKLAFLSPALGA